MKIHPFLFQILKTETVLIVTVESFRCKPTYHLFLFPRKEDRTSIRCRLQAPSAENITFTEVTRLVLRLGLLSRACAHLWGDSANMYQVR